MKQRSWGRWSPPLAGLALVGACGGHVTGTATNEDGVGGAGGADESGTSGASSGGEQGGEQGGTSGTAGRSGSAGTAGSAGDAPGNEEPGSSEDPKETARILAEGYTVWIGEADRTVTHPELESSDAPQRVVLILDPVVDQEVTGTLTFGTRPAPEPRVPAEPYPPMLESWAGITEDSWLSAAYEGFEYGLAFSSATTTELNLAFIPSEIYTGACPDDPPQGAPSDFCECPDVAPSSFSIEECWEGYYGHYVVDLTMSGTRLEGEIRETFRTGYARAAFVRLEQVR